MEGDIKKQFVEWTKLKIRIHFSEKEIYFREGEIWWASLGVNIGYEQNGKNETFERPVLILKKFSPDVFWMIPLSTKLKNGPFYHHYLFHEETFSACLTQIRLISSKRLLRRIGLFPKQDLKEIHTKIKKLL